MAPKVLNVLVFVCGAVAQLDIEGHKQFLNKQNKTVIEAKSVKSVDDFQIFNALGDSKKNKEVSDQQNNEVQKMENIEPKENVLQERQDIVKNPEDFDKEGVLYSTRFSITQKQGSDMIDRNSQLPNYNLRGQPQASPAQPDQNLLQFQPIHENLTPPLPYAQSYYQAPNQQLPLYNTVQSIHSGVPYAPYQQSFPDHQLQGTANFPLYQTFPQAYPASYYPSQEYRTEALPFGQLYPQNDYLTSTDFEEAANNKDLTKKYLGPAYENTEKIEDKVTGTENNAEKRGLAGVAPHLGNLGYGGHLGPASHLGHIGAAGHISPGHLGYGRYGGIVGHGGHLGYGGHLAHGGHIGHGAPGIGHKILPHGPHGHHVPVPVHVPIVKAVHHSHVDHHDHHHKHANQHTHKHNHIDEHDHKHDEEHNHVHRHTHHHDHHHNHKHHSEHAHEEHHKHEHGHQHHEHHVDEYL